jgi:hypothetical protein
MGTCERRPIVALGVPIFVEVGRKHVLQAGVMFAGNHAVAFRCLSGSPVHGLQRLEERLVFLGAFLANRKVVRDGFQPGRDRPAGQLPP